MADKTSGSGGGPAGTGTGGGAAGSKPGTTQRPDGPKNPPPSKPGR